MNIIQIAYASSATNPFSKEELIELLNLSRKNNQQANVTGMLLYKSGNFLQILEGTPEIVEPLLAKISRDPRHHGVITLLKRPIETRDFHDWSMAFRNLNDLETDKTPGFNEFLNLTFHDPETFKDCTRIERLIGAFATSMR